MNTVPLSLTPHEEVLIRTLRQSKLGQSINEDCWGDEGARALMAGVACVLDGYSVGFARHVLHGAANLIACATRFSADSAWFQQEAQALRGHHAPSD